ncbi:tetraspanin-10 isoform X2 [Festucalex cinctus]
MRLSMAMRGAERRPDRGGNLRQAGQGERRGGHVDVGPRSASDPDWLPGLLHHLLGMFWRAAQRHLPAQDVCVHPGAAAPPTAGGGNCGVPLHRRGRMSRCHQRCHPTSTWICDKVVFAEVMERTERLMMKSVVCYRDDRDLENAIDFVQKKFGCCGVDDYKDWSRNAYFRCSDDNPSLEACGVPFSCCVAPGNQTVLNTMCGFGTQREEPSRVRRRVFPDGCLDKIARWIKRNARMVGCLAGGLLLLQTCMMSLAWAQVCWINKVVRRKAALASRKAPKKDDVWLPAFADFDDQ